MSIHIVEEPIENLIEHGTISIAFDVKSRYCVETPSSGLAGIQLIEETVDPPFVKDYDQEAEGGPQRWLKRWKLEHWGLICAYDNGRRIGGAVVAWRTDSVNMLEGRDDLAVMWDLRVAPEFRGKGVGKLLFAAVEDWAKQRQCSLLKVETGTENVPACRFYSARGCRLGGVNQFAYHRDGLGEWQLLWYKLL